MDYLMRVADINNRETGVNRNRTKSEFLQIFVAIFYFENSLLTLGANCGFLSED
jgi:hypothetical protein